MGEIPVSNGDGSDEATTGLTGLEPLMSTTGNDIIDTGILTIGDSFDGDAGFDTLVVTLGPNTGINRLKLTEDTLELNQDTANPITATNFENYEITGSDGTDWLFISNGDTNTDAVSYDGGAGSADFVFFEFTSPNFDVTGVINDDGTASATVTEDGGPFTITYGFAGLEGLIGGDGDDNFTGSANRDALNGGGGNDTISGGDGRDNLNGNTGADLIYGGEGDDIITAGTDQPDDGIDTVFGGLGDDTIRGGALVDILNGDGGDDTFIVSDNDTADSIDGGDDTDLIDFTNYTFDGVIVDLDAGTLRQINGSSGVQQIANIENVTGSDQDDVLTGDDGDNILLGLDGLDVLTGGAGNDTLDGGEGFDLADYTASGAGITLFLGATPFADGGDATGDTLISIEDVDGSSFDDVIFGGDDGNFLFGNGGKDYLSGQAGNDEIFGGQGADLLEPGAGDDLVEGGEGLDMLSLLDATAPVTLDFVNMSLSSADYANDILSSIEGILGSTTQSNVLRGANTDDVLIGGNQNDILIGRDGDDIILGQGGDDVIVGGNDADVLMTGTGNDTVFTGGGADVMLFALNEPVGEGDDVITDFELGVDLIIFYGIGFGMADVTVGTAAGSTNALLSYGSSSIELEGVTEVEVNSSLVFIEP